MSSSTGSITSIQNNRSLQRKQNSYFNDYFKTLVIESDKLYRTSSRRKLSLLAKKIVKERVHRQMASDRSQRMLAGVISSLVGFYFLYYCWQFFF